MVQSLKLGGAQTSQAASGIKRVNRVPVIFVIVLLIAFLGIIFFGLASRGLYFGNDSGPDTSSGNPASTYADQIKRGVTDGIIGEPQQQTFQPTPVETKHAGEKAANPLRSSRNRDRSNGAGRNWSRRKFGGRVLLVSNKEQISSRAAAPADGPNAGARHAYDAPLAIDRAASWKRGRKEMRARGAGRRQSPRAQTPPTFMPRPYALVSAARMSIRMDRAPRKTSSMPTSRILAICQTASCHSSPCTN